MTSLVTTPPLNVLRVKPGEVFIPFEIRAALSAITQNDINRAGGVLPTMHIGRGVLLGPCPIEVRQLVAYSRRIESAGTDEAYQESGRLGKLAARFCESMYAQSLVRYNAYETRFAIVRGWTLHLMLL